MRKLPPSLECPVDNLLIDITEPTLKYLHEVGCTPNHLTTFGVLFRALSMMVLLDGRLSQLLFLIVYLIGFMFDCMDGFYARRYNMCTVFGDFYDHASDTCFAALVIYYHWTHQTMYHMLANLGLLVLLAVHIGCSQLYWSESRSGSGEYLDIYKNLPYISKDWLPVTRYFGCGTYIILSSLLCCL